MGKKPKGASKEEEKVSVAVVRMNRSDAASAVGVLAKADEAKDVLLIEKQSSNGERANKKNKGGGDDNPEKDFTETKVCRTTKYLR